MRNFLLILTISVCALPACRSKIKQQEDSVYSRHLQRHVALTVITTPMPNNKEEMNLLLFSGSKKLAENMGIKKTLDSLWKKKLIQPVTIVCFDGNQADYGMQETEGAQANQYQKFNDFVTDELYPFTKKNVVIRKFNSVAICGFNRSALSAFDIAWNNDEKIQRAGLFSPSTALSCKLDIEDPALLAIGSSRKRPRLDVWISDDTSALCTKDLTDVLSAKQSITVQFTPSGNFADFLLWAFPKQ